MTDDCPTTSYDATAEAGSWLSIPETARVLGITTRTVHRRIEAGQLSKRDLERGRVEVWVPSHLASYDLSESTPDASQTSSDTGLALVAQISDLATRQVTSLTEELGVTRRQLTEQAEEIGRLKQVERELAAEQARLATSATAIERENARLRDVEARLAAELEALKRRSWWSRLWNRA